jgi:Rod binding domain-containing protein
MTVPISPPLAGPATHSAARAPELRAARALEASFLAEMLKFSGFGEQANSFSGSAGEAQFASFHREALAQAIVRKGGLGLAEIIAASLRERGHEK